MRMLVLSVLAMALVASPLLALGEEAQAPVAKEPAGGGKAVAFHTLDLGGYAAFPKNWDDAKHPLRAALITGPQQWDAVLGAAFQAGKPAAPAAAFYEKEQLVMVSRVVNGDDLGKVFTVASAAVHGDVLVVRYAFKPGSGKAAHTVKDCLLVAVPRHDHAKVVLVENGRVAATLDKDHAQSPAPKEPDAQKPHAARVAACPVCAKPGIPIVYGEPGKELMDRAQRGEVVLGGCCVTGDDPHHRCKGCEVAW